MQVFLVRHAEAFDDGPDPARTLTPHGRMQASALGDRLRWYDCAATHVWTSPYTRATETAELIVAMMTDPVPVERVADLTPYGAPRALATRIATLPPRSAVMLVGHEPTLSELATRLANLDEFGPIARAQAVRIVDGHLRWHFEWDAEAPIPYRAR